MPNMVLLIELELGSHYAVAVKRWAARENRTIDHYDKVEAVLKQLKGEVKPE